MLRTGSLIWLTLLFCAGFALADGFLIPGPPREIIPDEPYFTVKYHHVETEIVDQVATTYIDQVFINNGRREMEATYIFPLPSGAVINNFTLHADGQVIEAKLLDKDEAQRIYEEIVRKRKDPALLTYMGNNAYQARIFPIPPRGERRIEIRYSEVLSFDAGLVGYVYPLNTERFSKDPIKSVRFKADIRSKDPISTVYSPSHEISVSRESETRVKVSYEEKDIRPDKDMLLFYTVSSGPLGANVITFKERGEDGFYLLLMAPTLEDDRAAPVKPKDVCFVLDTSGSMSGAKIRQAQAALAYCVESLNPGDRFNIVAFSDSVRVYSDAALVAASKESLSKAREFIFSFSARGGTDINSALKRALDRDGTGDSFYVVFITDGLPTVGETDAKKILKNVAERQKQGARGRSRIFVFGVGYDVNTNFLDRLAAENGGASTYVRENEDIEVKVSSFFAKIAQPVLTDLTLSYGGVEVYDALPRELPDLFHGSQLTVLGRYRSASAGETTLTLSGNSIAGSRQFSFRANFPEHASGKEYIAALWAARKIAFLIEEIRLHGEKKELVDEIVKLSREYGILTEYTAFLAEEPRAIPLREAADRAGAAMGPGAGFYGDAAGAGGVARAQNIQAMKAQAQTAFNMYLDAEGRLRQVENVRQIGQRGYANRNGRWEDLRYEPETRIALRVQAYSEAYFQLSRAFPALNGQLALGDRMVVLVNGHAVEIGPEGQTRLSDDDIRRLQRQAEQSVGQAPESGLRAALGWACGLVEGLLG